MPNGDDSDEQLMNKTNWNPTITMNHGTKHHKDLKTVTLCLERWRGSRTATLNPVCARRIPPRPSHTWQSIEGWDTLGCQVLHMPCKRLRTWHGMSKLDNKAHVAWAAWDRSTWLGHQSSMIRPWLSNFFSNINIAWLDDCTHWETLHNKKSLGSCKLQGGKGQSTIADFTRINVGCLNPRFTTNTPDHSTLLHRLGVRSEDCFLSSAVQRMPRDSSCLSLKPRQLLERWNLEILCIQYEYECPTVSAYANKRTKG